MKRNKTLSIYHFNHLFYHILPFFTTVKYNAGFFTGKKSFHITRAYRKPSFFKMKSWHFGLFVFVLFLALWFFVFKILIFRIIKPIKWHEYRSNESDA